MELYYMLLLLIPLVWCYPTEDSIPRSDEMSDPYPKIFELKRSSNMLRDEYPDITDFMDVDDTTIEDINDIESMFENRRYEDASEQYHVDNEQKRIVDGIKARKGGFPWQVGIYFEGELICGGSLLSEKYIMTAAHCFGELKPDRSNLIGYKVRLGEYERLLDEGSIQVKEIAKVKIHEKYQVGNIHANDIAIVQLASNAILNHEGSTVDRVFPACFPSESDTLKVGATCVLTGWGRTYAWGKTQKLLQELSTPIVSLKTCQKKNGNKKEGLEVTPLMLCSGDETTFGSGCMGDSGGPLSCLKPDTQEWLVYGVVSWGSVQCNGLEKYTVYTNVIKYVDWIVKNTNITPSDKCFRADP